MLKKIFHIVIFSLILLLLSCGGVNSDARKAAKFTNRSIEKANELKLQDAEKDYKKAQEIIGKYQEHKKSDKFFESYKKYRDEDKLNQTENP